MSAFGGLILTNVGRNLQTKAQVGTQLNFTRISVGDGDLAGSSILDLIAMKHEVKSLAITKLKTMTGGKAVIGTVLSNESILVGFYWRELGVFAQDPDLGEILYCYGNAGVNAEYITAGGGPDIIEKSIDVVTIVGNATNVTATLDSSLLYVTYPEFDDHVNDNVRHVTDLERTTWDEHPLDTVKHITALERATWNTKAPIESPTFTGTATAPVLKSTIDDGTAPLTVTSKTKVANLNCETVNGRHFFNGPASTPPTALAVGDIWFVTP